MSTKGSGQEMPSAARPGMDAAPAWAWSGGGRPDGAPRAAARAPASTRRPAPAEELAALRRELDAARADATEARRQLEDERAEAAARCERLEQRAEAALIQARADAEALNAVALAARATEARATLLAEEVVTLRAGRRRLWGR